jgi:hypothetical protein
MKSVTNIVRPVYQAYAWTMRMDKYFHHHLLDKILIVSIAVADKIMNRRDN